MKLIVITIILLTIVVILTSRTSHGDSEDEDENEHNEYRFWQKKPGVKPATNLLYQEECGSCHFAYQPGLLPSRSWQKIIANLDDHFGDNAELELTDKQQILKYLKKNSAEKSTYRRSVKIMRSLKKIQTPLRITKLPYFVHEHDDIPLRMVNNNPKVASLSQCDSCHQAAEKGSFNEHDIVIPGYGKWDD